MIRWLSQLWVSTSADRGGPLPRLWRWTFGRFASHQKWASRLDRLDGALKRQAASQRRLMSREPLPVGRYTPRSDGVHAGAGLRWSGLFNGGVGWLRPGLAAGSLAVVVAVAWVAWPSGPTQTPQELRAATVESFARVWDPLTRRAEDRAGVTQ